LFVKSLNDGILVHQSSGLRLWPITRDDSARIRHFNERYRRQKNVLSAACYLKRGYPGVLIFLDETLIGYWWWVSNEIEAATTHPCIHRFQLNLGDGDVYAFDYFIAPEYRAQGTAVKTLSLIYGELKAMGLRRIWGSVDSGNAPARWVYNVHGNRVVRRMVIREVCSAFVVQDRRVFIRNSRWNATHSFDHRLLFSLRWPRGRVSKVITTVLSRY